MSSKYLPVFAVLALLTACDVRVGNEAGEVSENASAAGRAEEGRLTIEAPGFNMSMNIPEDIRAEGDIGDDDLIYPGSSFGGIHVQGRRGGADGKGDGEVEIRFTTNDQADRVAAWYRDPARGKEDVVVTSVEREGGGYLVQGTARNDDGRFTVRLAPRPGGGTEGRLLVTDRG